MEGKLNLFCEHRLHILSSDFRPGVALWCLSFCVLCVSDQRVDQPSCVWLQEQGFQKSFPQSVGAEASGESNSSEFHGQQHLHCPRTTVVDSHSAAGLTFVRSETSRYQNRKTEI